MLTYTYKAFSTIAAVIFVLMVVADHFPTLLPFSIQQLFITFFVTGLIAVILSYKLGESDTPSSPFNAAIGSTLLLGLLALLAFLGGESQSNISITNPIVWIVYAFSIYTSVNKWKKAKEIVK